MSDTNSQPSKVSSLQLKISYWYVSHKLQLRQGLIICLIILSVVFYGYSLYKVSMIFLVEDKDFKQDLYYLSADLVNYPYFHQAQKPKDIQLLGFDSTDGREGRYDFVAKMRNSNPNFVATEVLVQLISRGEVIAEKTAFIYPDEEKYIAFFSQEIPQGSNPILEIARVKWWRYHQFAEFAEPRLKFEINEVEFKTATELKIRGKLPVSTLNFKVFNNSAYSYWQVGVYMILHGGGRIVGANYIALDQFRSGETREVEMRWYESLPLVSQVEILPEVDILNSDFYMPVE